MNPYAIVVLVLSLGANALMGYWLDHDERALGAVPSQILLARTQDAQQATAVSLKIVSDRVDQDQVDLGLAVAAQAKADGAHEKTMLAIQHKQDLATFYFGDASHDKVAVAWAAQPVPPDYYLGMCAALGYCTDQRPPAPSGILAGTGAGGRPLGDADLSNPAGHDGQPPEDRH